MGREIRSERFTTRDFQRFAEHLRQETDLLEAWCRDGRLAAGGPAAGFELEAWLVDADGRPAARNAELLAALGDAPAVPELSRFNIEINTPPRPLRGEVFSAMHADLAATLARCEAAGAPLGLRLATVGILPTVREEDLVLANMSDRVRFRALNAQVLRLRRGRPIELDIAGRERLRTTHHDVMLEAATTSFQIHLQVDPGEAQRCYNAAVIAAGPMVAASANSPFLFGRDLWDETRVPLFEQSVNTEGGGAPGRNPNRVTFGEDYARGGLPGLFRENLERFPVLLPALLDEPPEALAHLRLHNGTIWRWNRPLVGFDARGRPQLRIEHRVVPAGPSAADALANAALFYGLVAHLARQSPAPEARLPFAAARANFYRAARHGLAAELAWWEGGRRPAARLLAEWGCPAAREGLAALGVAAADIERYLGIIEQRVAAGRNGAAWQRAWRARHGPDMGALTLAYLARQHDDRPVHQWTL